jgi:hypothetical protein
MSTGRDPGWIGLSVSGTHRGAGSVLDRGATDDELQLGVASPPPPSWWGASGHSTSDSHSSSAALAIASSDELPLRGSGSLWNWKLEWMLRARSGIKLSSLGLRWVKRFLVRRTGAGRGANI